MNKWEPMPTKEEIKKHAGFIYIVRNKSNNFYYIGQKKFWFKRKLKPLKGKKRFRHKLVESDWRSYWGSSEALQKDLKKYGKKRFSRNIIRLCKTKAEMNYFETKKQFDSRVLFDDMSYNAMINCRISKRQLQKVKL